MESPRPQFGMYALLLATTAVAIALGGVMAWWRLVNASTPSPGVTLDTVLASLGIMVPFVVPLVFGGYWAGRRRFSVASVAAFAACEIAAYFITRPLM